jgi:hypothetical protein
MHDVVSPWSRRQLESGRPKDPHEQRCTKSFSVTYLCGEHTSAQVVSGAIPSATATKRKPEEQTEQTKDDEDGRKKSKYVPM